jgi:tRNA threonylcarbamoyladenosine biosynthesis protein TsaB
MSLILCIETSSMNCSVALYRDNTLIECMESAEGYAHSEKLHPFIAEVIKKSGYELKEIDALMLGSGPGSFTGLRIGTAAAKGMCFSLAVPMMSLASLRNMAMQLRMNSSAIALPKNYVLCPLIDARRLEVYSASFDQNLIELTKARAIILDELTFSDMLDKGPVVFFGDGMNKMKHWYEGHKNALFFDGIFPSALNLGDLAFQKFNEEKFEDVAYFEPFYLKGFQPTTPKNKV